jgi:hypothetical protein
MHNCGGNKYNISSLALGSGTFAMAVGRETNETTSPGGAPTMPRNAAASMSDPPVHLAIAVLALAKTIPRVPAGLLASIAF